MKPSLMLAFGKRASVVAPYSQRLCRNFSTGLPDKKPANYWSDTAHQKEFLEKLGASLGFKSFEDWYNVTSQDILKHEGGPSFLQKFSNSPFLALSSVYGAHKWHQWKFKHVATNFWNDPNNVKQYLTWLGDKLDVKDWYSVTIQDVNSNFGEPLVKRHQTIGKIISFGFQDQQWDMDKFDSELPEDVNQNHDLSAERQYLDTLGKKLGFNKREDWYKIAVDDFYQNDGSSILRSYGKSAARVVMKVFYDHTWLPWKFEHVPKHWAEDKLQLIKYIRSLEPALKVQKREDWYRISKAQLNAQGPLRITEPDGLYKVLSVVYPDHKWNVSKLDSKVGKKSPSQIWLTKKLSEILPNHQVVEDYTFENTSLEFDNYISSLKLAIDYIPKSFYTIVDGVPNFDQKMEEDKSEIAKSKGFTWIKIPYWWDGSESSLAFTINKLRPEIEIDKKYLLGAVPITQSPRKGVTDVKSTFFMLGHDWNLANDPTGWWMSEKFDGVRSYWDGKEFWSRTGRVIPAIPDVFKKGLPDVGLDGELWIGRGKYNDMSSLVKPTRASAKQKTEGDTEEITKKKKEDWAPVKFIVFDLPEMNEPFEARVKGMQALKAKLPARVHIAKFEECKGQDHLLQYIERVTGGGGEGVMLRKPGSMYIHGRVNSMMKVKPYAEAELKLLGVQKGVLVAETPDGVVNSIRCPPQVILNPPPSGSIITVKYMHRYKNNTLRAARFFRVRHELTWEDVLRQYNADNKK